MGVGKGEAAAIIRALGGPTGSHIFGLALCVININTVVFRFIKKLHFGNMDEIIDKMMCEKNIYSK